MTTAMTDARDAIRELRTALGWLAANLLRTDRPYRAPQISAAKRAELDALARLEQLERSGIAPGESPVPFDLDIADLLAEILTAADEWADRVCFAVWRPVDPPACSAFEDPSRRLDLVERYLAGAVVADPALAEVVEARCDALVYRAHGLLGLLGDGQLLNAVCPWCDGRTTSAPVGGARTMRVRAQLPAGKRTMTQVDPVDVRWFVVCESGTCEPPPADCGERLRGRPAWLLRTDGDWLAARIERAMAS